MTRRHFNASDGLPAATAIAGLVVSSGNPWAQRRYVTKLALPAGFVVLFALLSWYGSLAGYIVLTT